jgi:hypothetical protein
MRVLSKEQIAEKAADAAAVGAVATWAASELSSWTEAAHLVAALLAIVGGGASAWYHIVKIRVLRRQLRKDR